MIADRKIRREGVSSVVADDEEGAYQATQYLLSLGHKQLVYLSGRKNLRDFFNNGPSRRRDYGKASDTVTV